MDLKEVDMHYWERQGVSDCKCAICIWGWTVLLLYRLCIYSLRRLHDHIQLICRLYCGLQREEILHHAGTSVGP